MSRNQALLRIALTSVLLGCPRLAHAATPWEEILHLQDGRYNNAARIDYHGLGGELRMTWKWQIGTDSNTRQIAAGTYAGGPPAWSFDDLTANVSSKEYPDIAVAPDGVAHVVWREHLGGGNWQVFHVQDAGGVWSPPTQLTFDLTLKGSAVIAVGDSSGVVHIAYSTLESGTANDEIWYLLYDTAADTTAFLQVTNDAVTDDDVTIDVTPGGVVSLAWVSGGFTGAIRCVEGGITGFTDIPTGVTADAAKPDLELGPSGKQHIAYRHTITSGVRVIRYLRRQGSSFAPPIDASPSDAFYSEPSILVAGGDAPAIAFVSNTSGHKGLYVAQWNVDHFASPDTIHADPSVTYNETDLESDPFVTGLPLRAMSQAFVVTSTGYVSADTVRADLHVFRGAVTAVGAPDTGEVSSVLSLTAHPTPFRRGTTVHYFLPQPATVVHVDIYDVAGRRLGRLVEGARSAGVHRVNWSPASLPAGVYWIQLIADGRRETTRVHRLR